MSRFFRARVAALVVLIAIVSPALAAETAEKPSENAPLKRYLILHSDDAGMSHAVNVATIKGMEQGLVSSCSIMVPCPWFSEFAEYARKHPDGDYGIHLTLNSEWDYYRWGPVAPREKVPSLVDKDGYLWDGDAQVGANARVDEVEIELRAQIDRALAFGVPLSHLDTHMGALFTRPDLAELYIKLGIEYDLPVLFPKGALAKIFEPLFPALEGKTAPFAELLDRHGLPPLDFIVQHYTKGTDEERRKTYLRTFDVMPPGVTEVIIHSGDDSDELKGITDSWVLRNSDTRLFTDPEMKKELDRRNIELIGWKDFRKMRGKVVAKPAVQKPEAKYLIVHADDAGMSHNVNNATIETMEKGMASSCSIMIPCPWFTEFAKYAKEHPEKDYGIHLTLNSEWKHFRWGPVAPREKVPSLLDKEGYLWPDVPEVAANAKASEVAIELRAQIDRAKQFGVPLSHLDTHMGALVSRPDLIEVYVNLALEYKLPILWTKKPSPESVRKYPALAANLDKLTQALREAGLPAIDGLTTGVPDGDFETRKQGYLKVMRGLQPGVHQIIIHCGVGNEELKGITGRWSQRDEDRRIFTDPDVMAEAKKLGIELVGWKQVWEMQRGGTTASQTTAGE